MRKYLIIYAVLSTLVIFVGAKLLLAEQSRLKNNNTTLLQNVNYYRTAADESAASVQALRLRCGEYEELMAADAEKIRAMGVKIRRLESASKSVVATEVTIKAPLRDTIFIRDTLRQVDTLRLFRWNDSWVTVDGIISADSVECRVESIDTLRQIVHRVPRRFLFIKFGTKALRQEIVSTNPHSKIVFTEYIKIER